MCLWAKGRDGNREKEKERRGEGKEGRRGGGWMFVGSLRKSQIVLFQFGVYGSWKEILDLLFGHFQVMVREKGGLTGEGEVGEKDGEV